MEQPLLGGDWPLPISFDNEAIMRHNGLHFNTVTTHQRVSIVDVAKLRLGGIWLLPNQIVMEAIMRHNGLHLTLCLT